MIILWQNSILLIANMKSFCIKFKYICRKYSIKFSLCVILKFIIFKIFSFLFYYHIKIGINAIKNLNPFGFESHKFCINLKIWQHFYEYQSKRTYVAADCAQLCYLFTCVMHVCTILLTYALLHCHLSGLCAACVFK